VDTLLIKRESCALVKWWTYMRFAKPK
jgi:hypothetical protein